MISTYQIPVIDIEPRKIPGISSFLESYKL